MAITDIYCSSTAAGGGAGTFADPYTLAELLANMGPSVRGNIITGTYSLTTTDLSFTAGGDDTGPAIIRGVDSDVGNPFTITRSFDGTGFLDTDRWPVLSFTTGTLTFNQADIQCEGGIVFTTSSVLAGTDDYPIQVTGADVFLADIRIVSTYTGTSGTGCIRNNGGSRLRLRGVEFDLSSWTGTSYVTAIAFYGLTGSHEFEGCRFKGNGFGTGIYGVTDVHGVKHNIFDNWGQGTHNQDAGPYPFSIVNNTFYNCTECVSSRTTLTGAPEISYNVAYSCGQVYAKETAVELVWLYKNAAGDITSADGNVGDYAERNRISLTQDPFVNAAIGDFRLNDLAGGGLLAVEAGLLGNPLGALGTPEGIPSSSSSSSGTLASSSSSTGSSCSVGDELDLYLRIDLLHPDDEQANVSIDTLLQWRGVMVDGSPLPADLVWDVYFREFGHGPLIKVANGITDTEFDPGSLYADGDLGYGDTYRWKVVARVPVSCPDYAGKSSPTFQFTTEARFNARKIEPGDYVFGYMLYNSETARFSAFSEVAQVRKEEFESGKDGKLRDQYIAMEIVYDVEKYDRAYIYRSVKVQDAGGTFVAAIMHLDNIISLSAWHTNNNGPGTPFPLNQEFRQAVYYYELEDKQLVHQEQFIGHNIFDAEMPHGGAGMMFRDVLLTSKVTGPLVSTDEENRVGDAEKGLGELRWSSTTHISPELFPPQNRFTPPTPSNEIVKMVQAGHNAIGFSVDRMYHMRREGSRIRPREIHKGYGLINPKAVDEVGSVVFFGTRKGLKAVDGFAKLDEVHALDQVFVERWVGDLSQVSIAYDATVGALFILNPDDEELQVMWFNTSMLTSFHDAVFDECVSGSWPQDPTDPDDTLVHRAFFLQNAPKEVASEVFTGWKPRVYVLDHTRSKTDDGHARLTMLDVEGETRWTTNDAVGTAAGDGDDYSVQVDGVTGDMPSGARGAYLYVLEVPSTGDQSLVGLKAKIKDVNTGALQLIIEGTDATWLTLPVGARVGVSPMFCRALGHNLGLQDSQGMGFAGRDYHRVRQVNAVACAFSDVQGDPAGDGTKDAKFRAIVYRGNETSPLDTAYPVDGDGNPVESVVDDESLYWAAFGDDTVLGGKHGVMATVLCPGVETFCPDLDYRLLSFLVDGIIRDSNRTGIVEP